VGEVKRDKVHKVTFAGRPVEVFAQTVGKVGQDIDPKPKCEVIFGNCCSVEDEFT